MSSSSAVPSRSCIELSGVCWRSHFARKRTISWSRMDLDDVDAPAVVAEAEKTTTPMSATWPDDVVQDEMDKTAQDDTGELTLPSAPPPERLFEDDAAPARQESAGEISENVRRVHIFSNISHSSRREAFLGIFQVGVRSFAKINFCIFRKIVTTLPSLSKNC